MLGGYRSSLRTLIIQTILSRKKMYASIFLRVWVASISCNFKGYTMHFTQKEYALRLAQFLPVLLIVSVSIFWMHVAIALAVSRA